MKVLITGGAGMVGQKLAARLATDGEIAGQPLAKLTLFDIQTPTPPVAAKFSVECIAGDLSAPEQAWRMMEACPDVVFHLAAIVSGQAEQEFETGYAINLDGTRYLLEAARELRITPRFVFTSSIAVFGAPFPESIPDDFFTTPLTSYGTQKAIGELLVSDYSRKGLLEGISIRLPTICVRPGKPNAAASGFFSNIIREPLVGKEAVLPVSEDVLHWHASPRAAVGFLLHAATIDLDQVGPRRAITMPGVAATVGEQLAALRDVAGDEALALVRREPDPFIQKMVAGWPRRFDARRALELGFQPDRDFAEIIRVHLQDELRAEPPSR